MHHTVTTAVHFYAKSVSLCPYSSEPVNIPRNRIMGSSCGKHTAPTSAPLQEIDSNQTKMPHEDLNNGHFSAAGSMLSSEAPLSYNTSIGRNSHQVAGEVLHSEQTNGISSQQDSASFSSQTNVLASTLADSDANADFPATDGIPKGHCCSAVTVDEQTAERLRKFYIRNRRENQRHATMMAQSEDSQTLMRLVTQASGGQDRVEKFDVFSPDMRSTRWQEFLEIFAENMDEYDRYRDNSRAVRGTGKAMTLATVTRQNQNDIGRLH